MSDPKPWFILGSDEAGVRNGGGAKPWLKPELEDHGFKVSVKKLPAGDIWWGSPVYGRCGAEMKDVVDLLGSMDTPNANMIPRLEDELRRLQENVALPILLTHGWAKWEHFAKDSEDTRWSLEAVDNLLFGRQLRGIYHCRARNTKGEHGLTQRLTSLWYYTQKPLLDRLIVKRHFPYMGPMTDRAEVIYALLSHMKGLKNKRHWAEKLAAGGSIIEIVAKEETDLLEMGLSKMMAKKLYELTHGKEA